MRTVAVIYAGGGGPPGPGLLAPLGGRPLVEHSVAAFTAAPQVDGVLLVAAPALATQDYGPGVTILEACDTRARSIARALETLGAAGSGPAGGAGSEPGGEGRRAARTEGRHTAGTQGRHTARTEGRRAASTEGRPAASTEGRRAAGIEGGGDAGCNVLIHDADRPLVGPRVIADCLAALADSEAVCAAVPASDTMVAVENDLITGRPPRDRLRCRQYPQGFRLPVIRRGYQLALADPAFGQSDDCAVVLRYLPGIPVRLVPGSEQGFRVTSQAGLSIAETLIQARLR